MPLAYNNIYTAPGQGQTAPRGQNFYVNRKALSLYPFVASYKEISSKSDFIHVFHDLIYVYKSKGHTDPKGQSFDVNRNFLSLLASNHRRQSFLKNPVLLFSYIKA